MDKIYSIEKSGSDYYGTSLYRFYSLYNGTRGTWGYSKESAIKEGEKHQKIILLLHGYNQPPGLTEKAVRLNDKGGCLIENIKAYSRH